MSKLINKTRLQKFATDLWTKIKRRYDNAFVDAEITAGTETEKKIKFTKAGGGTKAEVDLQDYARLQDRNKFKQDVSVDNVAVESNAYIKNVLTNNSSNRLLGYRGLTSKNFVDGHISTLRVLVDSELENNTATSWKLWAIKKDNTNRDNDTVKKAYGPLSKNVKTVTINGETHKAIDFEINEEFTDEVYFVVKSTGSKFRITYPNDPYKQDVVNMSAEPGGTEGDRVNWDTNADGENTAIMYLYGRESIGSLSAKLDKVNSDSSTYVKHSDCTVEGEQQAHSGKVVKLDGQGKLSESILPSIAINEYIEVATFDHATLRNQRYENGDVVVVTSGGQVVKRYLCINKLKNPDNLTEGFVELNSKDGVVQSVEGKTGAVTLDIALEENKFKLKINGTGGTETVKEIEMISEAEITEIINGLS